MTTAGVRRILMTVMAVALVALAAGCGTKQQEEAADLANVYRGMYGLPGLHRSIELDTKAQAQAERMSQAGDIFHSASLASGVSPGWLLIGENVGMASTTSEVQHAFEQSPAHRANLLNPAYVEMGVGVVEAPGRVYVVQVFVQR